MYIDNSMVHVRVCMICHVSCCSECTSALACKVQGVLDSPHWASMPQTHTGFNARASTPGHRLWSSGVIRISWLSMTYAAYHRIRWQHHVRSHASSHPIQRQSVRYAIMRARTGTCTRESTTGLSLAYIPSSGATCPACRRMRGTECMYFGT